MDNIYIKKVWQDEELIELFIEATSEFVRVKQKYYVSEEQLYKKGKDILDYIYNLKKDKLYIEFGEKIGNSVPTFSMCLINKDFVGHYNIEMDMEIEDTTDRSHWCKFYVGAELGLIEKLGKGLISIAKNERDEFNLYTEE